MNSCRYFFWECALTFSAVFLLSYYASFSEVMGPGPFLDVVFPRSDCRNVDYFQCKRN